MEGVQILAIGVATAGRPVIGEEEKNSRQLVLLAQVREVGMVFVGAV
jgi:hypothetical protein